MKNVHALLFAAAYFILLLVPISRFQASETHAEITAAPAYTVISDFYPEHFGAHHGRSALDVSSSQVEMEDLDVEEEDFDGLGTASIQKVTTSPSSGHSKIRANVHSVNSRKLFLLYDRWLI